ncbi:MAG: hypothetical protein ABW189_06510 [Rickettsiales bacterium]
MSGLVHTVGKNAKGYVPEPRESTVYACSPVTQLVWHLLRRRAAWKPMQRGGVPILRGQTLVTAAEIDKLLSWKSGCRTESFGEEAVKHALRKLREMGEIATEAVRVGCRRMTRVTVLSLSAVANENMAAPSVAPSERPADMAESAGDPLEKRDSFADSSDAAAPCVHPDGRPVYNNYGIKTLEKRTPSSPPRTGDGARRPLQVVEGKAREGEAEAVCREAVAAWNENFADIPSVPQAEVTWERTRMIRRRMAHGWTLERWRELLAKAKAQPFALRWLSFDGLLSESTAQKIREGAYGTRSGAQGGVQGSRAERLAAFWGDEGEETVAEMAA